MAVVVASSTITAAAAVVEIIKSDDTTIEIIIIGGSPTEIGVIVREILIEDVASEATSKADEVGVAALVAGEEGTNAGIAATEIEGEVEAIV